MGINSAGLELVKRWEGCCLRAYQDCIGVWTIGYGHTQGVKKGQRITKKQATELLEKDLELFWGYVTDPKYVPLCEDLNDNQLSALCSFAFNCGANNLRTLCKNRSIEGISQALLLYNKAGGKYVQGLMDRRRAEQSLYNTKAEQTPTAESLSPSFGGVYFVIASALNLRAKAGTSGEILVTLPRGTCIRCYGYYTLVEGTPWLLVEASQEEILYTGFVCSSYLERI